MRSIWMKALITYDETGEWYARHRHMVRDPTRGDPLFRHAAGPLTGRAAAISTRITARSSRRIICASAPGGRASRSSGSSLPRGHARRSRHADFINTAIARGNRPHDQFSQYRRPRSSHRSQPWEIGSLELRCGGGHSSIGHRTGGHHRHLSAETLATLDGLIAGKSMAALAACRPPRGAFCWWTIPATRAQPVAAAQLCERGTASSRSPGAQFSGPIRSSNPSSIIDVRFADCPGPRGFAWNMWKHTRAQRWAFDIDGVLCRDPSKAENDDGPRYRRFLLEVEPLFLPQRQIGHVITSRLEKRGGQKPRNWLPGMRCCSKGRK